jgi:hypothetical protein
MSIDCFVHILEIVWVAAIAGVVWWVMARTRGARGRK